jgi:hypothetical protein
MNEVESVPLRDAPLNDQSFTTSSKFRSLDTLKQTHAWVLLPFVFRSLLSRQPTNIEYQYWVKYLLAGGDVKEMLSVLPIHIISANEQIAYEVVSQSTDVHNDTNILVEAASEKVGEHLGRITLSGKLPRLYSGRPVQIHVVIENSSNFDWLTGVEQPVLASYHWLDPVGNMVIYEGIRTNLPEPILPLGRAQLAISVVPPPIAGNYTLEVSLVHEGVAWMEDDGLTSLRLKVGVEPSLSDNGLQILKELQWARESLNGSA